MRTFADRRRQLRRRAQLGLIAVALVLLSGPVAQTTRADEVGDKTNQINQAQQQRNRQNALISTLQQSLQSLADRETQLRLAIAQLDLQIAGQQNVVAGAQAEYDRVTADLVATQGNLDTLQAELRVDRAKLAAQAVALYEAGSTSTLNALLSSDGFNELFERLIAQRRIVSDERTAVGRVNDAQAAVQQALNTIAADQQRQQQVLAQEQAAESSLESARAQRAATESELEAVQAYDQRQLQLAEQAKRELDAQIAKLEAERAAAIERLRRLHLGGGNGQFVWPERGVISQGFGCTPYSFEPYDPDCPQKHFHSGIDIAAPYGTNVVAADSGIAYLFVSSYGYGNHVIILHANGWTSVYGHLSGFAVADGQPVARGQLIGYEGSSGNSTGPHLHFEVRVKGTPVDPLRYL